MTLFRPFSCVLTLFFFFSAPLHSIDPISPSPACPRTPHPARPPARPPQVAGALGIAGTGSSTTLVLLDAFGSQSARAGAALTAKLGVGVEVLYVSEGAAGWRSADLPWREPVQGFTLDLSAFPELVGKLSGPGAGKNIAAATVAAGALAVGTVVLFRELEAVLEVIGIAGLLQLLSKRLLFAADRKKTLTELKAFVDTKIAPKEAPAQLQARRRRLAGCCSLAPARCFRAVALDFRLTSRTA